MGRGYFKHSRCNYFLPCLYMKKESLSDGNVSSWWTSQKTYLTLGGKYAWIASVLSMCGNTNPYHTELNISCLQLHWSLQDCLFVMRALFKGCLIGLSGLGTLQIRLEAQIPRALPDHTRCPDRKLWTRDRNPLGNSLGKLYIASISLFVVGKSEILCRPKPVVASVYFEMNPLWPVYRSNWKQY